MNSLLEPIRYISDNFGPRITGTSADLAAIDYIEKQFHEFTDDVKTDSFKVVGRSLQYLIQFLVWGYFLSAVCYFFFAPIALGCSITMLLVYYFARFQDKNLVNIFVKKSVSKNVIATFKPNRPCERILIFSGHHDSAFHMPLFEKRLKIISLIQNGAILGIALLVFSSIWKSIVVLSPVEGIVDLFSYELGNLVVAWSLLPDLFFLLALFGLILAFYFLSTMVSKTPLYGANDNLTSVALLFAIGEYLKRNPPENLEIRLISFGAEEPGLVGSNFYVKNNLDELNNAVNINFETLGSGELGVILKEKDNNVIHDQGLVDYLHYLADQNNLSLPVKQIHYGNTDAGSFSKKKIPATTIFGFGENGVFDLWHSTADIVENLDEKLMNKALEFTILVIKDLEKNEFSS